MWIYTILNWITDVNWKCFYINFMRVLKNQSELWFTCSDCLKFSIKTYSDTAFIFPHHECTCSSQPTDKVFSSRKAILTRKGLFSILKNNFTLWVSTLSHHPIMSSRTQQKKACIALRLVRQNILFDIQVLRTENDH